MKKDQKFPEPLFTPSTKEEFGKQAALYTSTSKALYFDSIGHVFVVNDEAAVYYGGHQQILSLEDVVRIAEGYRIAKDEHGNRLFEKYKLDGQWKYRFFYVKDEDASRNCPGVYIETKEPHLFPGVEGDLYKELSRLGWNQLTKPFYSTFSNIDIRVKYIISLPFLAEFDLSFFPNLYCLKLISFKLLDLKPVERILYRTCLFRE